MMMTISSSKRPQQISSQNTFHQWSGSVKKKVKDGEWQQVYVRITRSTLKCYQNEVSISKFSLAFFYTKIPF